MPTMETDIETLPRRGMTYKGGLQALVLAGLAACSGGPSTGPDADPDPADRAEVLRDTYGVPHVYAGSLRAAAFAWGYVHAEDLRESVLELLYAAEGRSARIFGRDCGAFDCAAMDALALLFEVPEVANAQYAALDERTRLVLEAYADGVNRYFEGLDPPPSRYGEAVTPQMVAGAMQLARIFNAMVQAQIDTSPILSGLVRTFAGPPASNQFAATGARTAPGSTVLGHDPHTPWGLFGRQPYVHLQFDDYDVLGVSGLFVGPYLEVGGNDFVQFAGTSLNKAATAVYVAAESSADGSSYFDHRAGGFVPFDRRVIRVEIAGSAPLEADVLLTRFGPVVASEAGQSTSLHVFVADDISGADYSVGSWSSRGFSDYAALWDRATPAEAGQNRVFASDDLRIGYIYGAYLPVLDPELDWSSPVSSADPRIEWEPERWYNLDGIAPELPHVFDPAGEFAQNCNGHPAWTTDPIGQVPLDLPPYLHDSSGPGARGRRMLQLLGASSALDAAGTQAIITDVRSLQAEDLIEALRRGLDAAGIGDPSERYGADPAELMRLLLDWRDFNDYRFTPDSEAATVLFHYRRIAGSLFPPPGATLTETEMDALSSRLDEVAAYMRATYPDSPDSLHVVWGYVNRVRVGTIEVGLSGAPFDLTPFVSSAPLREDGRTDPDPDARYGSWITRAVVLGADGFVPYTTVPQGQISSRVFPDSPHVEQSIEDFAALRMRRIWLDRAEVEANPCPFADRPGHEHPVRTVLVLPEQGS